MTNQQYQLRGSIWIKLHKDYTFIEYNVVALINIQQITSKPGFKP